MKWTVVVLVALLTLASCAQPAAPTKAPPSTSQAVSITTTNAPTPTTSGPSPKLFAAEAARSEVKISALKQDLAKCGVPADDMLALTCQFILIRAPLEGRLVSKNIRALGEPSGDIVPIVKQALTASDALGQVDVSNCEKLKSEFAKQWADGCTRSWMDGSSSVDDLLGELAGLKTVG